MYPVHIGNHLAVRLHQLVQLRRWPEALAQCWHSLVYSSSAVYHKATSLADRSTLKQAVAVLIDLEIGITSWEIKDFERSISREPLVLLRSLAVLAESLPVLASGQLSVQYHHSIYSGGVIECKVCVWKESNQEEWTSVYLVEAQPAQTDNQASSLHAYTSPYHLLPSSINNFNIKVSNSESPVLDAQLRAIRSSGRPLRIYVAEFLEGPNFKEYPKHPTSTAFVAHGLNNEYEMGQVALLHLESAMQNNCDILMYPELTITPNIKRLIQIELLKQTPKINKSSTARNIALVVCGSFHCATENESEFCNITNALDGLGNHIYGLTHTKLSPASIGSINEAVVPGNTLSLVATPIGLLCSCICLDLPQTLPGYVTPFEFIPFSFLFVPSLSETTNSHKRRATEILRHQRGVIIVANQAPATLRGNSTKWNIGSSFVSSSADICKPRDIEPEHKLLPYEGASIFEVPLPIASPYGEMGMNTVSIKE